MKKVIIYIIIIAIIAIVMFLFSSTKVIINIEPNTMLAETNLPENVTRFTDGAVTCYIYDIDAGWRDAQVSRASMSCVK